MINTNDFSQQFELQARPELIEMITTVSKEKGIPFNDVLEIMEVAISKLSAQKYGTMYDIRGEVNKANGAITIKRVFTVVENVEDSDKELSLEEAQKRDSSAVLGDELFEILPTIAFNRTHVQGFRQNVILRLREIEKTNEYEAYKDKVGEIVSGIVRRIEYGNVFVELSNKIEAFLGRDECIPREYLEIGSRIRVLIIDVRRDNRMSQILLSRSRSDFIVKLFEQEIPEIYENIIEIKSISRDAGSRSKVALYSNDPSIDAIGTSVGFKGSRIQGVLSELKGEKIDLIQWSDHIANFVINAFHPIEVLKVIVDQNKQSIEVIVKNDNLSMAIGRGGQNINLISKLVGWHIDLISEEAEKETRQNMLNEKMEQFKEQLDVDDIIAQLLAIENINSVEEIVAGKVNLNNIPGFNDEIISELKQRAQDYINNKQEKINNEIKKLNVDKKLLDLMSFNTELLLELAKNGINTLEALADMSVFDLQDIIPKNLADKNVLEDLIIKSRGL